jgi:hypothetical protein
VTILKCVSKVCGDAAYDIKVHRSWTGILGVERGRDGNHSYEQNSPEDGTQIDVFAFDLHVNDTGWTMETLPGSKCTMSVARRTFHPTGTQCSLPGAIAGRADG